MKRTWTPWLGLALIAAAGAAGWGLWAEAGGQPKEPAPKEPAGSEVRPRWKVNDQWVVQSASQTIQAMATGDGPKLKVDWLFTVEKAEKIDGAECHKVKVQCQMPGRKHPETTVWVDASTYALRQLETQLPVQGEFRTVTEKFAHAQTTPAPVFVPLSVVPLDMPVFLEPGVKATALSYSAYHPKDGVKAAGDVGFAYTVAQKASAVPPELAKKVLDDPFAKALDKKPTVLFELTAGKKTVTQVWQQGQPWAVYSSNGRTEARLVKFTPAP